MPIIGVIASSMKGAPGIPTIGTATNVGTARAFNNGAATVTFTPAAGAAATSFTATSSPGGFTATGASSPLTVAGLQSSTSYTFTVTATNASGTSAASAASNSITATTVPQAPTIGTATAGDASATVAYTAGATGGATITTFTATSSPGSLTGTGTSPITVSGLTNGTAYTFTVRATNANGQSLASAASNSVTPVLASSFDSIASTAGTGTGAITFSSIPQTYKMLQLRLFSNLDFGASDSGCNITFNGGTNSQISVSRIDARGTSASTSASNQASGNGVYIRTFGSGSIGTPTIINIYDYTSVNKFKTFDMRNGFVNTTASDANSTYQAAVFASADAITSITITSLSGSFRSTNSYALYGMK
jgi:hypothetical protein